MYRKLSIPRVEIGDNIEFRLKWTRRSDSFTGVVRRISRDDDEFYTNPVPRVIGVHVNDWEYEQWDTNDFDHLLESEFVGLEVFH